MERVSRAVWVKRVERWKDSGLSAKQFASETGVSAQSLTFWRWKLRRDGRTTERGDVPSARKTKHNAASGPTFMQLLPTSREVKASTMLEVVLANGLAVRVSPQFDDAMLLRLVTLLGGQS
jgi:transposase